MPVTNDPPNRPQEPEPPATTEVNPSVSPNNTHYSEGDEFDPHQNEDFQDLRRNAASVTEQYFRMNSAVVVTGANASFGDILSSVGTVAHFKAQMVWQAEIQRIEAVYAVPPSLEEAERALVKHRLVVLTGDAGSGKRGMALFLARNRWPREHIYEIAPRQNLVEMRDFQPEAAELSYIIDGVSDQFLDKVSNYDLSEITNRLREKDCYLIVTTQRLATFGHIEDRSFIVHLSPAAPAGFQEVLDRHIDYYARREAADPKAARQLVVEHDLFEQVVLREAKYRRVDELALTLVQVTLHRESIENVMRRFASVDEETVKSIYVDACHTTAERAFLIALAVFGGSPAHLIRQAATILETVFPNLGVKRPPDESYDPLLEEQRLYEKCQCRVNYVRVHTDIGVDERAELEFKTPGMGAAVLRYVWNEYFWLHAPLVFWLREIGLSGDFSGRTLERVLRAFGRGDNAAFHEEAMRASQHSDLRVRAAVAVGELMRTGKDMQMLRLEAIHEWVDNGKLETNLLVGVSIMVLMWDDVQRQTAMQLIYNWVHSGKGSRKPSNFFVAGVMAYGLIGLQYPDEALSNLCAAYQYHESAMPVVLSAIQTILDGAAQAQNGEIALVVFQYLATWMNSGDPRLRRLAVDVFLFSARMLLSDGTTRWPAPLVIAGRSDVDAQCVSQLFLAALRSNDSETRETAEKMFEKWGKRAEADWSKLARTFDNLIRVMDAQLMSERQREWLRRLLGRFSRDNRFFQRFVQ